ncbi:MAG: hypothetical protein CM1200mP29_12370 [Verrucomicrobiota bacterium]|nr:MAG: hypothetical protein CM1200mP29_12370 [Verrucomicrobiota bacterium]
MLLRIVLMPEPQRETRAFASRPGFCQAEYGLARLVVIEVFFPNAPARLGIVINCACHRQAVLIKIRNSTGEQKRLEFSRLALRADAHKKPYRCLRVGCLLKRASVRPDSGLESGVALREYEDDARLGMGADAPLERSAVDTLQSPFALRFFRTSR